MIIECTDPAPTGPGPYAFKSDDLNQVVLYWLTLLDGKLVTIIPGSGELEEEYAYVAEWKGKWRRLVPAN